MKEESKRKACEVLNEIEEKLVSELIDSFRAGLPDFWHNLQGFELFLGVRRALCPE